MSVVAAGWAAPMKPDRLACRGRFERCHSKPHAIAANKMSMVTETMVIRAKHVHKERGAVVPQREGLAFAGPRYAHETA
jgi:hypothetical protein